MIIWMFGMNGRIYSWNPSKRNIISLRIKKVTVIFVFCSTFDFLDRNGLWILQYSISKHRDWLVVFFEWNWVKKKCTRFVSKHLWHFPMDIHACKIFFFSNSDKSLWCLYKQNKSNETIRRLLINTEPANMPIDEVSIVRLFLCSV